LKLEKTKSLLHKTKTQKMVTFYDESHARELATIKQLSEQELRVCKEAHKEALVKAAEEHQIG